MENFIFFAVNLSHCKFAQRNAIRNNGSPSCLNILKISLKNIFQILVEPLILAIEWKSPSLNKNKLTVSRLVEMKNSAGAGSLSKNIGQVG